MRMQGQITFMFTPSIRQSRQPGGGLWSALRRALWPDATGDTLPRRARIPEPVNELGAQACKHIHHSAHNLLNFKWTTSPL